MIVARKIAVIAFVGVLFATPLLAVMTCPTGIATCARVSECPLKNLICQWAADSQKPVTDAACHACGSTLLPYAGKVSVDYPVGFGTVSVITMGASAGADTKNMWTHAFLDSAWHRAPRQLLLHCALLI